MMRQLKFNTLKKGFFLMLTIILLVASSCNQVQEKGATEASSEAPESTILEATFLGKTKDVKGHIAVKTDLNQKDPYGSTPLHIAATFGKNEIAILLIEGGANLNETNATGSTALHTAAFFGRTEIVKALLENNADITIRNAYNSTALESVSGPFEEVKPIYDQFSKDLGALGLKLDYKELEVERAVIAGLISAKSN